MTDSVATGPQLVFSRRSRYRLEPYTDILPSTSSYLVKGMLPTTGIAFYAGASKAGKTFICLDHCLKLASGANVMGRRAKQVGVVYVAAEDPEGCRARITAWRTANPRESATPFILIGQPVDLNDADKVDDLKAAIRDASEAFDDMGFRLGMIVFDTLARCLPGGDENNSADMSRVLQTIETFGTDFECLTTIVAHHGKAGTSSGIRGWSGMTGAADAILTVERDEETQIRTVKLDKVKNGPDGDVVQFTLKRVLTGLIDEDGEESWSCVVTYDGPADVVSKPRRAVALTPEQEIMLTAIRYVVDNGATQAPPPSALGVREGTRAVRRSDVAERAKVIGLVSDEDKPDAARQRLHRALMGLQSKQRLRVEGDLIWMV